MRARGRAKETHRERKRERERERERKKEREREIWRERETNREKINMERDGDREQREIYINDGEREKMGSERHRVERERQIDRQTDRQRERVREKKKMETQSIMRDTQREKDDKNTKRGEIRDKKYRTQRVSNIQVDSSVVQS